jgi:hypothetical protein
MKIIITLLLAFIVSAVSAQNTSSHIKHADVVNIGTSKVDSTSYILTEPQVVLITQLLAYGDSAAGNSDKISTRDYNNFHYQVLKVDSILRVQYTKKHSAKKDAKKP